MTIRLSALPLRRHARSQDGRCQQRACTGRGIAVSRRLSEFDRSDSYDGAGIIAIAVVSLLGLLESPTNAQEPIKTCPGLEVRSMVVSAETTVPAASTPAEIDISPPRVSATAPDAREKAVTVIARGPGLGSMDSRKVKTDLACTEKGWALTATIMHSVNYFGNVIPQEIFWRPKITLVLVLRQAEIIFQTTWRMRLTTGGEVSHGQSPPFPDQKYPITVTKTLRSASGPRQ